MKYRNCGSLYIGGTGDMFLCKDKLGADYIFKPAYRKNTDIYQPYRAIAQVLASKLQECISPQTAVRCEYYEINEKKGTIQPKISVLEELREALTELNAIPNEEYMKKFESYINLIDVDSKQKDLIYSNILLRKKNINAVLEVLKIKLDEKTQNDEVEL